MTRERLAWFKRQRLPLLHLRVDLRRNRFALYALHRLEQVMREMEYDCVICKFTEGESLDLLVRKVYLGPPIFEWTIGELEDSSVVECLRGVVAAHVDVATRNIATRELGVFALCSWEAGELPRSSGTLTQFATGNRPEQIAEVFKSLKRLGVEFIQEAMDACKQDEPLAPEVTALLTLEAWARAHGVPDTESALAAMIRATRASSRSQGPG